MKCDPASAALKAGAPKRLRKSGALTAISRRDDAFTLIELLVVIAIVAVLTGLLLPALSATRQVAQSAACKSRLRHLGMAIHLYLTDFSVYPNTPAKLERYLAQSRPVPAAAKSDSFTPAVSQLQCPTRLAYALNLYGCVPWPENSETSQTRESLGLARTCPTDFVSGPFLSDREVAVPNDMFVSGDTVIANWSARAGPPVFASGAHFQPQYAHRPNREYPDVGIANMLFCDGHVDEGRRPVWEARTDISRRRWNRDHLPHSEFFTD